MKVYVLTSGEYSAYDIETVKLDRESAETLVKIHPDWRIEEYDTEEIQIQDKYRYCVQLDKYDSVSCFLSDAIKVYEHHRDKSAVEKTVRLNVPVLLEEESWYNPKKIERTWVVYVEAKNAAVAEKIGLDLIAEAKYNTFVEEEPSAERVEESIPAIMTKTPYLEDDELLNSFLEWLFERLDEDEEE